MSAFQRDTSGDYIRKDPDAVLDYSIAWDEWLDGDTIASATWTVPVGLTKGSDSVNEAAVVLDGVLRPAASVSTCWISGGTNNTAYTVSCRVVTAGGRTDDRSFRILVGTK